MSRASVVVFKDHVDASIEAPAEDLIHYGLVPPGDGVDYAYADIRAGAKKYARRLCDAFVVRDGEGTRLSGTVRSVKLAPDSDDDAKREKLTSVWITTRLRFTHAGKAPLRFVTFQHRDTKTTLILLTRMRTMVRQHGHDDVLRQIMLTSGGNAETVEFDWSKPSAGDAKSSKKQEDVQVKDARSWLGDERFNFVHAVVKPDAHGAVVRVVVPLPTTQTWKPIHRAKEAVVSVEEQAAVIDDWRKRMSEALTATVNGKDAKVSVEDVEIIGPRLTEEASPKKKEVVSFYAGRLVGTLRIAAADRADAIDLDWKLFNEAVPAVRVLVIDGSDAFEYPVTSYTSDVRWRRAK